MTARALALLALLCAPAPAAAARKAAPSAWDWRNDVELSFVETSGNSKSRVFSGANTLEFTGRSWLVETKASALHGKTLDLVTAERFLAFEKARWYWSDDDYVFEKLLWKRDRFAGLRYRFDFSAGLGRRVFKTKRSMLELEAGGGQILEHEIQDVNHRGDSYKTSGKYTYSFGPRASFEQDAEYTHNLRKGSDSRHQLVSTLTAPLSKRLSLRLSFDYEFNHRPPPGIMRVDRTWNTSIVVSFGDPTMSLDTDEDYGEIDPGDSAPAPDPPADPGGGDDE